MHFLPPSTAPTASTISDALSAPDTEFDVVEATGSSVRARLRALCTPSTVTHVAINFPSFGGHTSDTTLVTGDRSLMDQRLC